MRAVATAANFNFDLLKELPRRKKPLLATTPFLLYLEELEEQRHLSPSSTSQANTLGDLSKDVALNSPPEDSVSDISFSPQSEHLAVASWDKKVRIYEITQSGGSTGKAFFDHEAPVLSCHWSPVSPEKMAH
jgi:WD40 repeat protein